MDVTKAPLLDLAAGRASADPAPQPGAASGSLDSLIPLADRVDIQPLDLAAALRILVAEVRAGLQLPVAASILQSPTQASQVLIRMFLQAVPDDASNPTIWLAASTRLEAALRSSIDRAVDAVAGWRNVPQSVVAGAEETRALIVSQLRDEPLSPLWLRPEWLGLAPNIERFWRRRRLARRGLADPDFATGREVAEKALDNRADDEPPLD